MNASTFRVLILLSCTLTSAGSLIDSFVPALLEPPLREIESESSDLLHEAWFGFALCVFAAAVIASTVGLFFFKNWARHLALASTVIGLGLYATCGSTVLSSLAAGLNEAGTMLWGAVIAIAYTSGLSARFTVAK